MNTDEQKHFSKCFDISGSQDTLCRQLTGWMGTGQLNAVGHKLGTIP